MLISQSSSTFNPSPTPVYPIPNAEDAARHAMQQKCQKVYNKQKHKRTTTTPQRPPTCPFGRGGIHDTARDTAKLITPITQNPLA